MFLVNVWGSFYKILGSLLLSTLLGYSLGNYVTWSRGSYLLSTLLSLPLLIAIFDHLILILLMKSVLSIIQTSNHCLRRVWFFFKYEDTQILFYLYVNSFFLWNFIPFNRLFIFIQKTMYIYIYMRIFTISRKYIVHDSTFSCE